VADWVNQAYAELCSLAKLYESSANSSALTAGDSSVTIPSTLVTLEFVVVTSGGVTYKPMEQIPFEELLRKRAFSSGDNPINSVPTHFARRYDKIEFWPDAAGGETLTFYGDLLPTALSADADEPIIPEPYRKAIEYGACEQTAEFKRDQEALQFFAAKYANWQQKLVAFINRRDGAMAQQLAVHGTPAVRPHDPSTDLG
jgi:hypothetical protein